MSALFTKLEELAKTTTPTPLQYKKLIFALLEDDHVSQHRAALESTRIIFDEWTAKGIIFPTEMGWINNEWFYYIILKERFEPEKLTRNEKVHLSGLKYWFDAYVPRCSICGLRALGNACKGTDVYPDVYLMWIPGENDKEEYEEEEEKGQGVTVLTHIQTTPLTPFIETVRFY